MELNIVQLTVSPRCGRFADAHILAPYWKGVHVYGIVPAIWLLKAIFLACQSLWRQTVPPHYLSGFSLLFLLYAGQWLPASSWNHHLPSFASSFPALFWSECLCLVEMTLLGQGTHWRRLVENWSRLVERVPLGWSYGWSRQVKAPHWNCYWSPKYNVHNLDWLNIDGRL